MTRLAPDADDPQHVFHLADGKRVESHPTGEAATAVIRELGETQHGVVARRQLIRLGLGKGLLQERLRTRLLVPIHRGVYAVGHRRYDLRHRWMAAVLASGDHAVLSHRSAGQLWALRGWKGPVEVTRESGGSRRVAYRIRQAALLGDEVTMNGAIPVTTLERTLLDLASALDRKQLARVLAAAERSGRLSWSRLRTVVDGAESRAGAGRLRQAVEEADPGAVDARSGVEVDFLGLCRAARIPAPSVNVLVVDELVDCLWPEQHLVVEIDTYQYHRGRPAFRRDSDRTLKLEAAGYRVLRVTDETLAADPRPFLGLVRRRLGL